MNNNKFEMRFHHDHDHGHDHDHDHHHHHHHGDDHHHHHHHEEENENKEEKTLRVLLVHWVNHNQSHEESFKEWVDKSRNMGKEDVAVNIEKAIEYMKKANEMFVEAKKHM